MKQPLTLAIRWNLRLKSKSVFLKMLRNMRNSLELPLRNLINQFKLLPSKLVESLILFLSLKLSKNKKSNPNKKQLLKTLKLQLNLTLIMLLEGPKLKTQSR